MIDGVWLIIGLLVFAGLIAWGGYALASLHDDDFPDGTA